LHLSFLFNVLITIYCYLSKQQQREANLRALLLYSFLFLIGYSSAALAENQTPFNAVKTQDIFGHISPAVFQIKVINKKSGKKSSIGSSFHIGEGLFITNYHVVSKVVMKPNDYVLEAPRENGSALKLKIRNIDVIHDLAVLELEEEYEPAESIVSLKLEKQDLKKGERVYSLGNPNDLGMVIIEGVYNGLLEQSLYQKILFSGAINPGMSGGPSINQNGNVIGINVARGGDDIGYLVPVKFVHRLLEQNISDEKWQEIVTEQLLNNSEMVHEKLNNKDWKVRAFGSFMLPENIDPAFKCWGSGEGEGAERLFYYASFLCETQDNIFISNGLKTGTIEYNMIKLESTKLNNFAFADHYELNFSHVKSRVTNKYIKDVNEFSCKNNFLEFADRKWKASLCARSYKKYSGLYDVFFTAALMGEQKSGYILELSMSGFSKSYSKRFLKKFLETVQ
jgi:S1-C subfamily serine protease